MNAVSQPHKLRLLIVEDQQGLAENIFEFLGEDNYHLDHAADGLTALHLLSTQSYDVVVLDVMLPGVNGLTICQRIRKDLGSQVPVIMLTARDSIDDKAEGFASGADDYLVKPFHLRELEMRIQALGRRTRSANSSVLHAGGLTYNTETLTAQFGQYPPLTLSGYSATILESLLRKYPGYADYDTLSNALWGTDDGTAHTIRTHVYTLRKQLKHAFGHDFIRTLHGRGYALTEDGE